MAEIYLATMRGVAGFDKSVVVKRIHPRHAEDPHFVSMLIDEAKLSVQLNHQNIVQTLDLGQAEGAYFIVMEHVEGYDVHHVLRELRTRGERFSLDLAAYLLSEVCRGLDYAHRRTDAQGRSLQIVHRDVSPQNVLLSFAGEVKVADFGIAKAAHHVSELESGIIKGKYLYMSPEQAWGRELDLRSDIFSAGVLLWEVLTGRALHEPSDSLLAAVRAAEIPAPSSLRPDCPRELDAIVGTATARAPEARYPDAGAMADALRQFLARRSPGNEVSRLAALLQSIEPPRQHSIEQLAAIPKTLDRSRDVETVPGHPELPAPLELRAPDRWPESAASSAKASGRPSPAQDPDRTLPGRRSAPRRAEPTWLRRSWPWALLAAAACTGLALATHC